MDSPDRQAGGNPRLLPGLLVPDLTDVVRLQEHFPEQAEEQWREAWHGELRDDLAFIRH